jgi:predicted negative regulator of RcsB-dependent stress response
MANGRQSAPRRGTPLGSDEDAISVGLLRFILWARQRVQLLIGVGVALVVLAGAAFFFYGQRSDRLGQAAAELDTLQQVLPFAPMEEWARQFDEYLAKYAGTPFEAEARLVYGEMLLQEGQAEEAIGILRSVAPGYRTPMEIQATFLLAVAQEQLESWGEATRIYGELETRAQFTFQRREATQGLARVALAQGDTAAAIAAFERLVAGAGDDEGLRSFFEMRLAELGQAPAR